MRTLFSGVLFLLAWGVTKCFSSAGLLTAHEVQLWQEDLAYLHSTLEARHFDLYHTVSPKAFSAGVKSIADRLPGLNHYQLQAELMTLVQSVGDGHTMLHGWQGTAKVLPIRFKLFDNDWRVVETSQNLAHLHGHRLIKIGDHALEDVLPRIGDASPTQAESSAARAHGIGQNLSLASLLYGLGISHSPEQVTMGFRADTGEVSLHVIPAFDLGEGPELVPHYVLGQKLPQPELTTEGMAYYPLEGKTGYLDWNGYPGEFSALWFAYRLNSRLEKDKTESLIIDLRDNGGGNFFIGLLMAQFLIVVDHLNWRDGIYVLTNSGTFSAAATNAIQFRQILNAQLVGETAAGNPHGIQDADSFELPNSGLSVIYSKRKFRFTQAVMDGLPPDKPIKPSWPAYEQGEDEILNWVLQQISLRAMSEAI